MTEDKAKTKWCPFARNDSLLNSGAHNRTADDKPKAMCIGYDCMAWRAILPIKTALKEDGYCGLAGDKGAF